MDSAGRADLIEKLRASRDAIVKELATVSELQTKFKPSPDRWSIKEIVEHLAIVEHGMCRLITASSEPTQSTSDSRREEVFEKIGTDRSRTLAAPDRVRPRGRYVSLSNALNQFTANRERTIQHVDGGEDNLRMRITSHLLGRISCRECLGLMIGHPLQHLEQIREVQANPGYPS